jgi:hypothetical protein
MLLNMGFGQTEREFLSQPRTLPLAMPNLAVGQWNRAADLIGHKLFDCRHLLELLASPILKPHRNLNSP